SYVQVPADPAFDIPQGITIEGWIKTTSGFNKYIVTKNEDSFYLGVGPVGAAPNKLSFWLNGVTNSWVQSTTNVNDGQWHHVAGTYDGAFMKVYVDGQLENSVAKTGSITTGTAPVYIGRRPSEGVFNGLIDELTISARALSAVEIAAIHTNGRCGGDVVQNCAASPPSPIAWWRLDGNGDDYFGHYPLSTFGSGATYEIGEVGQGFHPDVSTILEAASAPALTPNHLTLEAWVHLDDLPAGTFIIVWKGDGSGSNFTSPYELLVYGNAYGANSGHMSGVVGNSIGFVEAIGNVAVPVGSWCHLALTADRTTVRVHQNGQLVGSAAQTEPLGDAGHALQIGGISSLAPANSFPGTIDEVALYGEAASPAQIQAIYQAGPFGKCPI